jgi:hypothetical protein
MKEMISSCLDIFKRKDVQNELKICFKPILEIINPYIYMIFTIFFIFFIMLLAILILLLLILRNKQIINKIL